MKGTVEVPLVRARGRCLVPAMPREFPDYQDYLAFMDELEARRGTLVGVNVARRA